MLFFKPKNKTQEILPPPPPISAEHARPEEDSMEEKFPDTLELETGETEFDHFDSKLMKMEKSIDEKFDFRQPKNPKHQKAKLTKPKNIKGAKNKPRLHQKPKTSKKPAATLKTKRPKIKPLKNKNYGKKTKEEINDIPFGFPDRPDDDLSFEDAKIPQDDYGIQTIEEEIGQAISNIRKQEQKTPKKSLFGIFKVKNEKGQKEYEQPFEEKELPVDDVEAVTEMIRQARNHLENLNLELSKKTYLEIIERYNKMDPKLQSLVYQEIRELYTERKNAESMKIA